MCTNQKTLNPRNTLLYWLVDVEGIDRKTADRIIAFDRAGIDPCERVSVDLHNKIRSAFDGFACVVEDC